MSATAHLQGLILRYMLLKQPFVVQWYVALHTAASAAGDSGLTRQAVSWTAAYASSAQIRFPSVVTPFTCTHIGLWDGPASGNLLLTGTLSSPVSLTGGQVPIIQPGVIQVVFA